MQLMHKRPQAGLAPTRDRKPRNRKPANGRHEYKVHVLDPRHPGIRRSMCGHDAYRIADTYESITCDLCRNFVEPTKV